MITNESDLKVASRKVVKVSDLEILHGAVTTKFWHVFFNRHWSESAIMLLKQYLRFSKAMMAFMHWSVFRVKPGSHTMGFLIICAALCFSLSYNSSHVPAVLKPFAAFVVPFVPLFKSPHQLSRLIFIDVESRFIVIYTILFLITSLIHLLMIWFGKGNTSLSKRGESWIVLGLSRYMNVNEFFICGIVEPLISVGIAIALLKIGHDTHGFLFMLFISLAEASQQFLDKAHQSHTESILRA